MEPIKIYNIIPNEELNRSIYPKNIRYDEEIWIPIINYVVNGIKPWYFISNFGRVYSISPRSNGLLHPSLDMVKSDLNNSNISKLPHYQIGLSTIYGKKMIKLHRLVLKSFYPIPGCELLDVNHKDGNPSNNHLSNLEWVNSSGNTIHAINNGFKTVFGFERTILLEKEIEQMFLLYEEGYRESVLSKMYGISVNSIRLMAIGKNRPYIKERLDLINSKYIEEIFTKQEIKEIIYYISNNINDLNIVDKLINYFHILSDSKEDRAKRIFIKRIYRDYH